MKKIKQLISLAVILSISGIALTHGGITTGSTGDYFEVEATKCGTSTDISEVLGFYTEVMNSPEWYSSQNRIERGEMLQISEEILKNLSTEDLIEAVLAYPFFMDVYAFDDVQIGVDIMYNTFNGLRELSERKDAAVVLLSKYADEPVLSEESLADDYDIFRLANMEILLAQNFIVETLNETQIEEMSQNVCKKYSLKQKSEISGEFLDTMFFTMIDVDIKSQNLEEDTKNALLHSNKLDTNTGIADNYDLVFFNSLTKDSYSCKPMPYYENMPSTEEKTVVCPGTGGVKIITLNEISDSE